METVIIVENNAKDCQSITDILNDEYQVISCDKIEDVNQFIERYNVVGILLTLDFADKDAIVKLSNYKNNQDIRIPLIVSGEFKDNLMDLLNLGVSEVILKPFNCAVVKLRVSVAIQRSKDDEYRIMVDYDNLTKIYNRQSFYREVKRVLKRNIDISYDLVCFDIDRFKIINDLYGSSVGDALLKHIADRGTQRMKEHNGLIGRLNSDLFGIMIPHQHNIEELLLQEMIDDINQFDLGIKIVVSFGFYNIDDLSMPVSKMCDRAMMAIKKIKNNYNTSYAVYDDKLRNQVLEEQRIIDEMGQALENDEFVPFYQPKVNMGNKSFIGYEALMRWVSPTRGLIPPGAFIPIFEKNGFISKVDRVIWHKVCRDLAITRQQGRELLPVSVNVSRIELYKIDLGEEIISLLNKYDIPIELFQLEITETAYMQDSNQMIEAVSHLKKLGFKILMDDFGSGFSSLNILKELPFDTIKIDLAFLEHFDENNKAEKILRSVVQMAKRLNVEIIAEGVETSVQEEFLVEVGCNRAQGYLFARPIPIEKVFEMIDSGDVELGDIQDAGNAIVNVDDILSTVYQQGEIDWYRQALLELNAQIFEYDFKRDNMIVFDTPVKENSSNLAKMEIPNYSYNVKNGRVVHLSDIERYQVFFKGNREFKISYRRYIVNQGTGYAWVKDTGRTIYDEDGNPKVCIGVSRIISDEKLNEQMMHVLSVMEQSTDFDSSINTILTEIGEDFFIDRISLMLDVGDNYEPTYLWQEPSIELAVPQHRKIVKSDVYDVVEYFKENSIIVLNKGDADLFNENTNEKLFERNVQTIVMISLNDDEGDFIGVLAFSMLTSKRKWRIDELGALQELTKCINVYLNKEKLFKRLDNFLDTYRRVMNKLNDGILMFTKEVQPEVLYINNAYLEMMGIVNFNNDNFMKIYYQSVDLKTQQKITLALNACIETGKEQTLLHTIKKPNQETIKVKTIYHLSPVKDEGRAVIISITTKQ